MAARAALTRYAYPPETPGAVYRTAEGKVAEKWWLRSPGYVQNAALEISEFGSVPYCDSYSWMSIGVRPVIWLDLDAECFLTESAEQEHSAAQNNQPVLGVTVVAVPETDGLLPWGALVLSVTEDSNASRAGIQPGDIIVQMGDRTIRSAQDLVDCVRQCSPEDTVDIKYYRTEDMREAAENQDGTLDVSAVSLDGSYIAVQVLMLMN